MLQSSTWCMVVFGRHNMRVTLLVLLGVIIKNSQYYGNYKKKKKNKYDETKSIFL